MIKFTVYGDPKGKERPRAGKYGFYTPSQTKEYQELVRDCYNKQCKIKEVITEPICIEINAFFSITKSFKKSVKEEMAKEETYCPKKPDFDNIAKIITDALNNRAYLDDRQICKCKVTKKYSENPRVEVIITRL